MLQHLENAITDELDEDFVEEVEKRLGNEVWVVVRSAINRKIKFKKVNFKKDEIRSVRDLCLSRRWSYPVCISMWLQLQRSSVGK